jgi:hypothetical protein
LNYFGTKLMRKEVFYFMGNREKKLNIYWKS